MNVNLNGTTLAATQRRTAPPPDDGAGVSAASVATLSAHGGTPSTYLRHLDTFARAQHDAGGAAGPDGGGAADEADVDGASFERRFAALAADPDAFHALLGEVFGAGHDSTAAEALRARALGGDFDWLPDVAYVGADVLGGAHGAYDAKSDTIHIDESLRGTALGAEVFAEEAGHALDVQLNGSDTAGDEGELFRRLLSGEALGAEEVAAIRAEDDTGTIVVDGEVREVEFWNPLKKVGKWFEKNVTQPIKENVIRPILESPVGEQVLTWVGKGLDGIATIWDRVFGGTTERGLNQGEIDYLGTIYGDSIDYGAIRIEQGGVRDQIGARSNTVEHDIFMSNDVTDDNLRDASGTLTDSGREWLQELGHEAMHIWQFEHGGSNYIGQALGAQFVGDGYDLTKALNEGKSFADMNPEQQGRLAEYIGAAILADGTGTLTETEFERFARFDLDSDQWDIVQDAHATLLAG